RRNPMSATLDIPISGMTCASCAGRVERALNKLAGVRHAEVNLASERARVETDDATLDDLIAAVERAGYQGPGRTLELAIDGMTCASCVGRVERALGKVPGVRSVSVNLAGERARLQLVGAVDDATLIAVVAKAGYRASLLDAAQPASDERSEERRVGKDGRSRRAADG